MPASPPAETKLDASALRSWPLPTDERDDKRGRGTVLVVGGSPSTPGAALLAGVAALRMGAGRLQIATDPVAAAALAAAVPEALVRSYDDATGRPPLRQLVAAADAVVFGPGLSDLDQAIDLLAIVLDHAAGDAIVVIDALGIDAFATRSAQQEVSAPVIITPNREELHRLLNGSPAKGPAERVVATDRGVAVVSFGRIATPDGRSWFDPGEVSGLGTSGAGDVLAGAIGGVAARSKDVVTAACWGTLSHRIAANRLSRSVAPIGYLARELVDELAGALAELGRAASAGPPAP